MQGTDAAMYQWELAEPPSDGISALSFCPEDPNLLYASSWDKKVRLYDVTNNQLRSSYQHKAAVLDVCFADSKTAYSAGLDRTLKSVDVATNVDASVGTHDEAICSVVFAKQTGQVITGSWDKSVKMWDPRSNDSLVGKYDQREKVFSMDVTHYMLVVAMAGRNVDIYDIRNMNQIVQQRTSSLKFMTRTVKCMRNGQGYASSSIEGRVAVEFFDMAEEVQAKKYAFKCHRQTADGIENIYPVNALTYHPIFGTFASGGGDGCVSIWDGENRKRNKMYPRYPTSISALSFNSDGKLLAIASSYTYEEGEKDHPADSIFIRAIGDEVKPKKLAASS
ncbi:WD40-repeat-containing domain protein [Cladochytrium replicatum]|nr:WD40-repeat-containing domain protein [Cladochytrium replicatum]